MLANTALTLLRRGLRGAIVVFLLNAIVWPNPAASGNIRRAKPTKVVKSSENGEHKQKVGALPFLPSLMMILPWHFVGSVDVKGIAVKGDPDEPKLEIGGRIHFDASAGSIRPRSVGPALEDNTEIRRAWFEPTLMLPNGIIANLQYDFSKTSEPVNNALASYRGLEPFILTIGNFKEPFSLDQLITNNNTMFVERSLLDAFAPARDFGAAVGSHGDRWTAVAGVFGGNINTDLGNDGIAGTARVTYAPILTDKEVLHLGLAGSYRALDPNGEHLSFSSLPEDDLAHRALVDTGSLNNASDVWRLGVEGLYENGSGYFQGEYVVTAADGRAGTATRLFQAGYLQAAYVVNGDAPLYELVPPHGSEYARLGGVKVSDGQRFSNGGLGVFEVAMRLSAITLQDSLPSGGTETDGTLGLNWYPDNNVKLMANYIRAHASPAAQAVATGRSVDSNLFLGRLQFYW